VCFKFSIAAAFFILYLFTKFNTSINKHFVCFLQSNFDTILLDRTNNHVEASHRHLQNQSTMAHPTIWKFIDGLKKSEKGRDMEHEQMWRVMNLWQKKISGCW